MSPSLAHFKAADLENTDCKPNLPHVKLSAREFQIFCKLAAGISVSAIGKELSLSVKTVSTYRTRALQKMGFETNADITGYALCNGLLE
jgi:two-component system invasion response regulator UvrY